MKALLVLGLVGAGVGAKYYFCGSCCSSRPESDVAPTGGYVEARTASVFAGACHYNSELVTVGREALLAWHFDSGRVAGTSLAGVEIAAALASSENLAQGASRKSVLYVDSDASEAQREAAVEFVRASCAASLGEVVGVESVPVNVAIDGERYSVEVEGFARLDGAAMADRECCKMPLNVWYEPLASIDGKLVGNSERFEWREKRLAASFENTGQNDAFLGRFGEPRSCCAGKAPSRANAITN
jgi:hypothetical protein